tara:strand:- start:238 stop:345 length:108 start_codon:yes stop_codon:yes gene_type:complete
MLLRVSLTGRRALAAGTLGVKQAKAKKSWNLKEGV